MNNKFALSFGISLVIVGFLNIIFETSSIVLFGLSISTLFFSLVNIIVPKINNYKAELLYVLPFVILVSIFCYSNSLLDIKVFNQIVNSKITNILTFISFGLLFISEFRNHKREMRNKKEYEATIIENEYETNMIILMLVNCYMDNILKKGILLDEESRSFLDKINELCDEKSKLAKIDLELLSLEKEKFTIEEFNVFYKSNSKILNVDKISEDYEKQFSSRRRDLKGKQNLKK